MIAALWSGVRSLIGLEEPGGELNPRTRVVCHFQVDCVTGPGVAPVPVTVLDISRSGFRLGDVPAEVRPGQHLWIGYRGEDPLPAGEDGPVEVEVVWARKPVHGGGRLAGVRFTADLPGSWVYAILREVGLSEEEAGFRRRRQQRLATALGACLRDPQSHQVLALGKVANLSIGGVLVQTAMAFGVGQTVEVQVAPASQQRSLVTRATVISCRAESDEQLVALQFDTVSAKDLKTVKHFMFHLQHGLKLR